MSQERGDHSLLVVDPLAGEGVRAAASGRRLDLLGDLCGTISAYMIVHSYSRRVRCCMVLGTDVGIDAGGRRKSPGAGGEV